MGAPESSLQVMLEELHLARYAAKYWMKHAKAAEDTHSDDIDYRIVRFLECEPARSNWIQLFDPEHPRRGLNRDNEVRVVNPPLYYASGGLQTSQGLLDKGANVNAQGGEYGNALSVGSHKAHEAVVRLLLEKGADVNGQGGYYGNALQAASLEGHKAVVRLLLEKGVEADSKDTENGRTPLSRAAGSGHEVVVQLLRSCGAGSNLLPSHHLFYFVSLYTL
jgi:ankyrin repeat protein